MMDSSCKYSVSPVDTVAVSMNKLSLLKVPSDESLWPRRNCIAQTVQHVYQLESDDDKTSDCGSSCTDTSDGKSFSGESIEECVEVLSECSRVSNSSFHQMTLRPKLESPSHCIITLYDDPENEESSDEDYTVDLDRCDSSSSDEEEAACSDEETDSCSDEEDSCSEELTSSDEDSVDSDRTLTKEDGTALSTEESSDTDEDTAESSSSDEETEPSVKESSDSENDSTESSSSDEETELPVKESSDSEDNSTESSSSDEEIELSAKNSSYSDEDLKESSSSDRRKTVHRTKKPSDFDKESSLLTKDSDGPDEECETLASDLDNCNKDHATIC